MERLRNNMKKSSSSLLPLGLLNFFIYGTMVIFTAYFQLYLQDIGLDKLEIGSLMAIGPFVSLLAHPFWRYWSDREGNLKNTLLFIMIGLLIMIQLVFKVNTYHMLYFSMILLYFFQSPLLSQTNSLILGYVDGTEKKFRKYRFWGSLGWSFVALAAGPIIDSVGHNGLSLLFSIMLLMAIGSTLVLPKVKHATITPWLKTADISRTLHNRYFISFIIFGLLVAIPNSINTTFMPLFISDLGGSRLQVGGAIFVSTLFEVGVFWLLKRYLKHKITYLMACITLVSLLFALRWYLMALATTPKEIILIQVLHAVTFGGFFYVGTQLTALFLPRPSRSSGQAVFAFALSGVAAILAGFLGGWIFQNLGAIIMYKTGSILTLCGAAGFGAMWYRIHKNGYSPGMIHKEP